MFVVLYSGILFSQVYYNKMFIPEESASDSITYNILHIETAGNFKTKEYIILRELLFTSGDEVSLKELFFAQKRVLNLFLFNRVIFDLIGEDNDATLLITVAEMWYVFPLPILHLNERSWRKISYGAELLYYNFLGRDIVLNLRASFGYNPEMSFSYFNPWFGGDLRLMTNFSVFKSHVKSLNLEHQHVEDRRTGINWMIGKRFGHFFSVDMVIGYMELKHPEITMSASGKDELPALMINFQYDNRDLKEYPHQGNKIHVWGKHVKNNAAINYYRYGVDLRKYLPVTSYSTLALRAATNLSHGVIPLYDRVFIGYGERIRGQFYEKYEGENIFMSGVEFRFPVKKIRYFDLTELAPPGFENYYQHLKFGISAGLFLDCGAVWFQGEKLNKKYLEYGYGAGLHFHLPYVDVFRVELGLDKDFNYQVLAEAEVAF